MLFTDNAFLYYFLPLTLIGYTAAPGAWKAWTLALVSYVFYGWWRPDFVFLIWISTIIDYSCGRGIGRDRENGRSGRRFVTLSCVTNLGLLAYFKYANFGVDTLNALLANAGQEPIGWTKVILPVGISFYTFQTLSYTIDVYRRDAEPVSRFGDFACYVSMFPQLVAGPIVRYSSIAEQLRKPRQSWSMFSTGMHVFMAGFVKKVLLADVFARAADAGFGAATLSTLEAWTAALSYTFQIYFDFSGYSDMAIGIGLMFGFRFPINFDRPYVSRSITEFWRRWHITLSSFLRDYLYIPLGGNRKGPLRTYVHLALTMLLGGLWHGAAWTFVAWGAYQGFWLVVERLSGRKSLYAFLPGFLQNAVTFILVVFGWVLFRSDSMEDALRISSTMLGLQGGSPAGLFREWAHTQTAAFLLAPLIVWACATTQDHAKSPRAWWPPVLLALTLIAILQLQRVTNVPFLYFQF